MSRGLSRSRSNSNRRSRERAKVAQIFVSRYPNGTHADDLRHLFEKYGRVKDVNMKRNYAFIEFSDPRDSAKGLLKFIS
jgi:arginine/serine-rich splicing factor 7